MINWICGAICGSVATLLIYSIMVGKMIQEAQEKATKCIFKYEGYRRKIRTLEYQNKELEKRCNKCKYEHDSAIDEPCVNCSASTSYFEPKEKAKWFIEREIKKHDK